MRAKQGLCAFPVILNFGFTWKSFKPWPLYFLIICWLHLRKAQGKAVLDDARSFKHTLLIKGLACLKNMRLVKLLSRFGHMGNLLTYSMVQSRSWEANWFAASQEIPRISRNSKVHYRTHKPLPPVSILGQPNPVHIPTSHFLEIHPNIIHPSTLRSLSLRFVSKASIPPVNVS